MRRKSPEQDFQISLVRDLRKILPSDCLMTAFPAGGGGMIRGSILKAMGLLPGMPDLLFVYHGTVFGMELKARSRKLTPAQVEMHVTLAACGILVAIVRTLDDALVALKFWNIPTRIAVSA